MTSTPLDNSITTEETSKTRRKRMSRAEWWAFWSGVAGVGFTVMAAIAGLVAWYWSNIASKEHAARTQAMELSIAEQRERTAKAETEVLELKERARPRTLTDAQHASVVDAIRPYAGVVYQLVTYPADSEPAAIAERILKAVEAAGWVRGEGEGRLLGSASGIVVIGNTEGTDRDRAAAEALADALAREGIDARATEAGGLRVGVGVKIQVARKP